MATRNTSDEAALLPITTVDSSDNQSDDCIGSFAGGFATGMVVTLLVTGGIYIYMHKLNLKHEENLSQTEAFTNPVFGRHGSVTSRRSSHRYSVSNPQVQTLPQSDPFSSFSSGTGSLEAQGSGDGYITVENRRYSSDGAIPEVGAVGVTQPRGVGRDDSARRLSQTMMQARMSFSDDPLAPKRGSGISLDGNNSGQSSI